MKIALLNVADRGKKGALNKDLAGGMGIFSNFGSSFVSKMLALAKKRFVKLPVLSFAFLQAILREKGHETDYFEGDSISKGYDLALIYGSIVDFRCELEAFRRIKKNYPRTKTGFFGSFPSVRPDLFREADFVVRGEAESFFLYEFQNREVLFGEIKVKNLLNLDDLPSPDFDKFPIKEYSYFPGIKEKPFLVLQASKGCPYSCSYYCPYGAIQGPKYRIRSAEKVVDDIACLVERYKIKGLQFRDPVFGLDKEQTRKICELILSKKIKIKFGIETRLDLLDKETLLLMYKAGLRNIEAGIETTDQSIAGLNNRKLVKTKRQEEIIEYCQKTGIKISAFYIFGLQGDTEESIKKTTEYALKLNTNTAQFFISCPYPGTEYYQELKSKNLIIENDFEKFDSSNLVFKHNNLTKEQIMKLKERAFKKFYLRPAYLINFLKWRIREF